MLPRSPAPDVRGRLRRRVPVSAGDRFADLRLLAALCLPAAALALPATASAAGAFKDRVTAGALPAHAAQVTGATTAKYPTADGQQVEITAADPAVAQRYATLVGTFPHGSELSALKMIVVPAAK